jgi:hypothetical protein
MRIDTRAEHLLTLQVSEGDDNALLSSLQVAKWLKYSLIWLKKARERGTGPAYQKPNAITVRYRRGDVKKWLKMRDKEERTAT